MSSIILYYIDVHPGKSVGSVSQSVQHRKNKKKFKTSYLWHRTETFLRVSESNKSKICSKISIGKYSILIAQLLTWLWFDTINNRPYITKVVELSEKYLPKNFKIRKIYD